jgi:hypothetical protein
VGNGDQENVWSRHDLSNPIESFADVVRRVVLQPVGALAMFGSVLPLRGWLGLIGIVSAAGILVGTLEPAGFEAAANIVVIGYILWSIWLALTGIFLLLTRSNRHRAPQANPVGNPASLTETLAGSDRAR